MKSSSQGGRLDIRAGELAADAKIGQSIAVNGCCLTVARVDHETLSFDLLEETFVRTNFVRLTPGALLNLERALIAGAPLGGHFVQGHIDATAPIRAFEKRGNDHRLEIELPPAFAAYVAEKGSVAVDGISLTVAEVTQASFAVWIIPHTFAVTNLRSRRGGEMVNLEFDILAKYVSRIVAVRSDIAGGCANATSQHPAIF